MTGTSAVGAPVAFHLELRAVPLPPGLTVVEVTLREALSTVSVAEITLQGGASTAGLLDAVEVLGASATLFFDRAESRAFHGIVVASRVELRDGVQTLRVDLAPRLWRASRSRRSRVYLDQTVADIARRVMQENGFSPEDFHWRCAAPLPPRPYTAQYEETDLDFLHRTLEREGIFYFITHRSGRDQVVFADHNNALEPLGDDSDVISFAPQGGGAAGVGARTWSRHASLQPRAVAVRDYSPAAPRVVMNPRLEPVMADRWTVDESGLQSFYGDHVLSDDEARRAARLRAELFRCEVDRYRGATHVSALRAGCRATLQNHPVAAMDQSYAVVSVTHRFVASFALGAAAAAAAAPRYENEVEAIPLAVTYRPPRVTPRPAMPPWIPAVVDGPQSDTPSPLDAKGRYRVVFPFDTAVLPGQHPSCAMELAQPFGGAGFGQHHPLHRGTHVLVGHLHGDPDRPVIVAVMMPSELHDPTTRGRVTTRAGVTVEYDDDGPEWTPQPARARDATALETAKDLATKLQDKARAPSRSGRI